MSKARTYILPIPVRGEASIFPMSAMPPRYALKMQNVYISENGGVKNVPGYAKINTSSAGAQLLSGFEFKKTDGSAQILTAGGGNIYKLDTGNVLTAIKTGLNTDAEARFTVMNNLCIMVNGVDAPMKNDMSAVANLGGSPPATAFKAHVHKGRVWMIERLNKLLATYSALNNPEDYTTANNAGYMDFKFLLPEGEELLDIITYIDLLVFFFKNYIAIYSGTNPTSSGDFALVQLIKGAGIAATDMAQMSGTVCIYQYTYKAWVRMVGADVLGMFGTTDGRLYLCGTGFLYQYDSGKTFAGVNIKWIWETAWLTLAKGLKAFLKLMEVITFPDTETTVNVQLR